MLARPSARDRGRVRLDDVIIPTKGTLDDHLADVIKVCNRLIEAGFAVRCDKFHLAFREAPYLGFLCGQGGHRPQPAKTAALIDMIAEDMGVDASKASRYAGMIGFYRQHLPDLHSTLAPFHELKEKGSDARRIMTSLRFKAAFAHTKYQLARATALQRPDFTKPFYIDVDTASSVGCGAILSQRAVQDDPDSHAPLAFWSRRLSKEERRYGARDQECLGLVDALENWRVYAVGGSTFARTDHKSLETIVTSNHKDGSRGQGFAVKLQGYDVTIQYQPGADHKHDGCDFMSRSIPSGPSASGGGIRGALDDRPSIHDRVNEAADIPHATRPSVPLVAITSADPPSLASANIASTVTPRPDFAFAAFLQPSPHGLHFLLHSSDGQLSFPGVGISTFDTSNRKCQLVRHLSAAHPDDIGLFHLLHHRRTVTFRYRNSQRGVYLYVVNIGSTPVHSHSLHSCPANLDTLRDLTSPLDRYVGTLFAHHYITSSLEGQALSKASYAFEPAVAESVSSTGVMTVDPEPTFDTTSAVPTIDDFPYGPANVVSVADAMFAVSRLRACLDAQQNVTQPRLSVDLEGPRLGGTGHICYIQVQADSCGSSAPTCNYVFDVFGCGSFLLGTSGTNSQPTLRDLLEDASVVKLFHCCYGDTAALFNGYGIRCFPVFDTSVADAIALGVAHNKQRGLLTVLHEWLGSRVAEFTYKSQLVHTDSFWDVRPLLYYKFVYAYEDVIYLSRLYDRFCTMLSDTMELVLTFSQQRAPPASLARTNALYLPPSRVAIALVDSNQCVVCLQSQAGLYHLPHLSIPNREAAIDPSSLKDLARKAWTSFMGPPTSKGLRAAINARLRKGVRIGDTELYLSHIPDGFAALTSINVSRSVAIQSVDDRLVCISHRRPGHVRTGVEQQQLCLFQYLHHLSDMVDHRPAPVVALYHVAASQGPGLRVSAHLSVRSGCVSLSLSLARYCTPYPISESYKASTEENAIRSAVILSDGLHAYFVVAADNSFTFPSHSVEPDCTLDETAAKGFDLYAGVALRKRPGVNMNQSQMVMPRLARCVRLAEAHSHTLGIYGNTNYVVWPFLDPAYTLHDHLVSFHAARSPSNGFQMNPSTKLKFPSFTVFPVGAALTFLPQFDKRAFSAALSWFEARRESQHSDSLIAQAFMVDTLAESFTTSIQPSFVNWHWDESQHSEDTSDITGYTEELCNMAVQQASTYYTSSVFSAGWHDQPDSLGPVGASDRPDSLDAFTADAQPPLPSHALPDVGVDEELDRLFTSAVAVRFAELCERPPTLVATQSVEPPALTRAIVQDEQLAHPALLQVIERLRLGSLAEDSDDITSNTLKGYSLDDGVLVYRGRSPSDPPRIVIPPNLQSKVCHLYHDFNNHHGVKKILPLILRRFYWGTDREMRTTLSAIIGRCEPCNRTKVHAGHRAGRYQIGDNGDHPFDVLSGDVFDVGVVFDDYSHTLDFVCHFSRRVVSIPTQGMPASEVIARSLIDHVIRHHGKPREVRSDHASNFISKAIRALYDIMKIQIVDGTAYTHRIVALVERWHLTLKQVMLSQRAAGADDDWPSRHSLLELAYNATVNDTLGYSPFFIDHLRECVLPMDAMISDPAKDPEELPAWVARQLQNHRIVYDAATRSLRLHAITAQKRYDLKHDVSAVYQPGDRVLLIRGEIMDKSPFPKASIPTDGPFTIARRLPRDRYALTNLHTRRIHNVVHVSRLVNFPKPVPPDHPWMVSDPVTGGLWPVHSIVGRRWPVGADRTDDTDVEYRVQYLGISKNFTKWIHLRYLSRVLDLVSLYDDQNGRYRPDLPLADTPATAPVPEPTVEARRRARFTRQPRQPPGSSPLPPIPETSAPSFDHLSEPLYGSPAAAPAADDAPFDSTADSPTAIADADDHHAHADADAPSPPPAIPSPAPAAAAPPPPDSSLPVYGPHLPDTSDIFPIHTRVDVYFGKSSAWYPGTVLRSRVYSPRTPGLFPDRVIVVEYDDPAYRGETFEHHLRNSVVRRHQPRRGEPVYDSSAASNARERRRLERLQRQLS